jgi:hypothetical protein
MGDVVNIAARLEAANKELSTQCLATENVFDTAPQISGNWVPFGLLKVFGRKEPVLVRTLDTSLNLSEVEAVNRIFSAFKSGEQPVEDDTKLLRSIVEGSPYLQPLLEHLQQGHNELPILTIVK